MSFLRAVLSRPLLPCLPSTSVLRSTLLDCPLPGLIQIRTSTKKGGGSSKNGRNSSGKRLGIKIHDSAAIKTGQIISRQRGLEIKPGQHVGRGRDFTLFALAPGYVKFYDDYFGGRIRKFVGIVLEHDVPKEDTPIHLRVHKTALPRRLKAEGRSRFFEKVDIREQEQKATELYREKMDHLVKGDYKSLGPQEMVDKFKEIGLAT